MSQWQSAGFSEQAIFDAMPKLKQHVSKDFGVEDRAQSKGEVIMLTNMRCKLAFREAGQESKAPEHWYNTLVLPVLFHSRRLGFSVFGATRPNVLRAAFTLRCSPNNCSTLAWVHDNN